MILPEQPPDTVDHEGRVPRPFGEQTRADEIGVAHRAALEFEAARTAWTSFLNEHPLDRRAGQILFDLGEVFVEEAREVREAAADESAVAERCAELFRAAVAQWRKVVAKYPSATKACPLRSMAS